MHFDKNQNQKVYVNLKLGPKFSIISYLPELKAQVKLSSYDCKQFSFSHSSPKPLGQFQPNLAHKNCSIMGIDCPHSFLRGNNSEIAKIH